MSEPNKIPFAKVRLALMFAAEHELPIELGPDEVLAVLNKIDQQALEIGQELARAEKANLTHEHTNPVRLDSDSLEYSARWIENSLTGETNERVIEFGKNLAMSIRAAKTSISNVPMTSNIAKEIVCPDCDGTGELAGDYFSSDGMFSCGRCQGRGVL